MIPDALTPIAGGLATVVLAAPHDFLADFAGSPAGWLAGLLTPVLTVLFVRKASRDATFRDQMWKEVRALTAAQAEQTRALSVLVANVDHNGLAAARVPELSQEVAVLRDRLDRHEAWSRDERNELRALSARQSTGGTP